MWVCVASPATAAFVATYTWNPSDKTASMTLANGNIDAINPGTNANEGVRGTASKSTGSWYIELVVVDTRVDDDIYVGFGTSSLPINANPNGTGHAHLSWRGGSGAVQVNGVSVGSTLTFTTGSILSIAIKFVAATSWRIWVMKDNSGTWLKGGDPAADTTPTGISTNLGATFPFHITDNCPVDSYNVRMLAHAGNQNYSAPSGFTPIGD